MNILILYETGGIKGLGVLMLNKVSAHSLIKLKNFKREPSPLLIVPE